MELTGVGIIRMRMGPVIKNESEIFKSGINYTLLGISLIKVIED